MEEMNLIIAVDVPYEVQVTATGIPMHEAKVEFCLSKRDVSYNFPTKMIDDKKFVFILTDALKELTNKTHKYKLYVYYGNARFEADEGSFNLVDKTAFDVEMRGDKETKSLVDKLMDKTAKKPQSSKGNPPAVTEEVLPTKSKKKDSVLKVKATKPTPTPETTTPLERVKEAIRKTKEKKVIPIVEDSSIDPNQKIKDILSSINKYVTPSIKLSPTPETPDRVIETQQPGKFSEEVDRLRKTNESRKANKKIKDVIARTTKKK